jgi:outer membrane protein assembly factor BamE
MRIVASLTAAFLALSTAACVYKVDVQQGNLISQDMVSKLKKGMTKTEVRQVLGTPLLMDPFHGNRWDYYFSTHVRGRPMERSRFSVYFENDKLVSLTGDVTAAALAPPAPATAPAAAPNPAAK